MPAIADPRVAEVFGAHPPAVRRRLLELRALIFATAAELEEVGPLEETLRWGEPTYLTTVSRSGSMVRLNCTDPSSGRCGIYVHCQTDLIATFKQRFGESVCVEGKRAVMVDLEGELPTEVLQTCIGLALTYRVRKAAGRRRKRRESPRADSSR